MKQWLEINFVSRIEKHDVRADPDNKQLGIVDRACPNCTVYPLVLTASAPRISQRYADTIEGNGHTRCCGDPVGYVFAQRETLFGLEEDRAVLEFARCRVYSSEVRIG